MAYIFLHQRFYHRSTFSSICMYLHLLHLIHSTFWIHLLVITSMPVDRKFARSLKFYRTSTRMFYRLLLMHQTLDAKQLSGLSAETCH